MMAMLVALASVGTSFAQTATPTPTTFTSTINYLFVICDTQAVIDFSGTIESGYDVYYQVFSASNGGGTALTALRRLAVGGDFRTTETVALNTGSTVAAGQVASMYVAIAREGNAQSTIFSDYVDDIQDGCRTGTTTAPTTTSTTTTTTSTSTVTSTSTSTVTSSQPRIRSPFGGFINPGYTPPGPAPVVQIGPSQTTSKPRQQTPGVIFAECNQFPMAEPGILYDTDLITIFWSWYAATEEDMLDHINNVQYAVAAWGNPFSNVVRTEIEFLGGDYWVFYYVTVGNLQPGQYQIDYKVYWNQAISDGYDDFGPGTDNVQLTGNCSFTITRNPSNTPVNYTPFPR
ncbi:MAG: hypothetical protein MUE54_04610 [Anaerolineae bacterium]|nr:hypothetical protein [Anaerolineae bacterium]